MKEQNITLDITDNTPDVPLVKALDVHRVMLDKSHPEFAEWLGMSYGLWYAWRKGKPPKRIAPYLTIIKRVPHLRAKVFRYLTWLALGEDNGIGS